MRKNDLIALLRNMEGNPEIMLWNGYTSDFMNVGGLVEGDLVKQTWEHYVEMCRLQDCSDRKDWNYQYGPDDIAEIKKSYAKHVEWEVNPYVSLEDVKEKQYRKKRIVYVNAKRRGKQCTIDLVR